MAIDPRRGVESPPDLTDEDEAALDRAWAKVAERRGLDLPPDRRPRRLPPGREGTSDGRADGVDGRNRTR